MLKYLTHKLRTHSINEDNAQEKIDGHDSGTESDTDVNEKDSLQDDEHDMEFSLSSRYNTTSPTDTVGSSESPAFLGQAHLMYDHHSSEEELEVINGHQANENESYDLPQRSSSTVIENRKRSLAQSTDEEVRNLLEFGHMPVNFRTSPPLEAFKPHRSHVQRATTPLVLTTNKTQQNLQPHHYHHYHHHPHHHHNHHHNQSQCGRGGKMESIRISCDNSPTISMDVRSISPPAKLFHCAVSPRRRQLKHNGGFQRIRPHRPCLDFDKMQQLKARSLATWRHNNEKHTGEFSVFCW